jgi:hypothetical protein
MRAAVPLPSPNETKSQTKRGENKRRNEQSAVTQQKRRPRARPTPRPAALAHCTSHAASGQPTTKKRKRIKLRPALIVSPPAAAPSPRRSPPAHCSRCSRRRSSSFGFPLRTLRHSGRRNPISRGQSPWPHRPSASIRTVGHCALGRRRRHCGHSGRSAPSPLPFCFFSASSAPASPSLYHSPRPPPPFSSLPTT